MSSSERMPPSGINENRVHRFEVFKACFYFSIASIGMLLANKGVILGLKSPWLLILTQNLVSCVFFLCMFKMKAKSSASLLFMQHSVRWIPAMLLFSVNIVTSMVSLRYISVATFSVIRNLNPFFSSALSYIIFGEKTAMSALIALVAVLFGSILYAYHDLEFQLTGYAVCLFHVVSMSLYSCVVKYISQKLEPLEMSILNNVLSVPVIAIISFSLGEFQSVRVQEFFALAFGGGATTLFFSCSCILGCCISITAFACQAKMSPTAFLTLNNCNKIPAILLSTLLFHGHISITSIVGIIISLAGGYIFALVSLPDSQSYVFNFFGSIATQTKGLLDVRRRGVRKHVYIWFAFLLIWLLYSLLFVIPLVTKMTSKKSNTSIGIVWQQEFKPDLSNHTLFLLQHNSRMKQIRCNLLNPGRSNDQSVSSQVKAGLQNGNNLPVPSSNLLGSLQPRLCYNRVLNTGFGDRLSVYLTVAAAAATVSGEVYTFWEPQPDFGCTVCDVSFDRIQQYVTWPPNLKVLTKEKYNEIAVNCSGNIQYNIQGLLESYWAFDGVYSLAWKTMRLPEPLPTLQLDDFVESYRQVAKQLKINITKHPMLVEQKYVVLHVRAGDKSAPPNHFNTFEILRQLPQGMPIIVITDDDEQLPLIIPNHHIPILNASTHLNSSEPSSLRIFRFPRTAERYEALMQDFQVLLGATGIIQHALNAWSSYSSVAAMMNAIPLLNTWITHNPEVNSSKIVGLLAKFEENGDVPAELKSAHRKEDVERFMGMMICVWEAFLAHTQSLEYEKAFRKNMRQKKWWQAQARKVSSGVDVAPVFFRRHWTYVLVLILMLL